MKLRRNRQSIRGIDNHALFELIESKNRRQMQKTKHFMAVHFYDLEHNKQQDEAQKVDAHCGIIVYEKSGIQNNKVLKQFFIQTSSRAKGSQANVVKNKYNVSISTRPRLMRQSYGSFLFSRATFTSILAMIAAIIPARCLFAAIQPSAAICCITACIACVGARQVSVAVA